MAIYIIMLSVITMINSSKLPIVILETKNKGIKIAIPLEKMILINSFISIVTAPQFKYLSQPVNKRMLVIQAEKLVARANPAIPRIFEKSILNIIFIITPIVAFLTGTLVFEWA